MDSDAHSKPEVVTYVFPVEAFTTRIKWNQAINGELIKGSRWATNSKKKCAINDTEVQTPFWPFIRGSSSVPGGGNQATIHFMHWTVKSEYIGNPQDRHLHGWASRRENRHPSERWWRNWRLKYLEKTASETVLSLLLSILHKGKFCLRLASVHHTYQEPRPQIGDNLAELAKVHANISG